ncbi:hypothetical protein AC1031_007959 [Aphanomyces cochlioides]|nr:hypothetical protein AC1031_007959 [Aphanomyces cochlioides]
MLTRTYFMNPQFGCVRITDEITAHPFVSASRFCVCVPSFAACKFHVDWHSLWRCPSFFNLVRLSMSIPATWSKVILVVLNLAFLAAGSLLIYSGSAVGSGHWTEVYSDATYASLNTFGHILIGFGSTICWIALFGLFGVFCRSKCLLLVYGFFVFVGMAIFIVAAVLAFGSASTAKNWAAKSYPADLKEVDVAKGFNQVYCYAEAGRLCTTASGSDVIAFFLSGTAASTFITAATAAGVDLTSNTGVVGFCKSVDDKLGSLASSLPSEYKTMCSTCASVKDKYGDYAGFFDWAEEKCALTATSTAYCGKYIVSGSQPSSSDYFTGAPYSSCRPAVYDLWKSTANKIATGSTILAIIALVVLIMSCQAAKNEDGNHYSSA